MDKYSRRRVRKARQQLNRDMRAAAKQGQVWFAAFSQEAFDMQPGIMLREDCCGKIVSELCTRGNIYRRPDGSEVLITAVFRSMAALRTGYHWDDKQCLGVVCKWDRCIFHDEDPRSRRNIPVGWWHRRAKTSLAEMIDHSSS